MGGSANQCRPFSSPPAVLVQPHRCHQTSPDEVGPTAVSAVAVTSLHWFHFSSGPPVSRPVASDLSSGLDWIPAGI